MHYLWCKPCTTVVQILHHLDSWNTTWCKYFATLSADRVAIAGQIALPAFLGSLGQVSERHKHCNAIDGRSTADVGVSGDRGIARKSQRGVTIGAACDDSIDAQLHRRHARIEQHGIGDTRIGRSRGAPGFRELNIWRYRSGYHH